MNAYVVLDGKNYSTMFGKWDEVIDKPATIRPTLDGLLDGTYGNMVLIGWEGTINVPIVARFSGWGIKSDFITTIKKRQTVTFTDHYGNMYNVHVQGPFRGSSLTPMFDGQSNMFHYPVRILIDSNHIVLSVDNVVQNQSPENLVVTPS